LVSVLSRYLLFQLPELVLVCLVLLALVGLDVLGTGLAWGVLAVWVVKEIVLFPFVRRAYEPSDPTGVGSMLGATGAVIDRLDPEGTIRLGPELWAASLEQGSAPVEVGAAVQVVAIDGLRLTVVACDV